MDRVSMLVAKHLELDVPGVLEEFFDVHRAIAEGRLGFLPRGLDAGAVRDLVVGDSHPAAPPAYGCLVENRVADVSGGLDGFLFILDRAFSPGKNRRLG